MHLYDVYERETSARLHVCGSMRIPTPLWMNIIHTSTFYWHLIVCRFVLLLLLYSTRIYCMVRGWIIHTRAHTHTHIFPRGDC